MKPGSGKPSAFSKLEAAKGSGAGYDLVANILVGLGIVWLVRRFWPELPKAWYAAGVVLGAASGFYHLFKAQSLPRKKGPGQGDAQPPAQLP